MSLSEDIIKQVDDFLNNTMSNKELKIFKEELSINKELQDYVSINKEMRVQYNDENWQFAKKHKSNTIEALETYFKSDESKSLHTILKSSAAKFNKSAKPKSGFKSIKIYNFFAVAASLVLLIGIIFFNPSNNLYNDYNSWDELPSLTSRNNSGETILSQGETAFVNKNYKLSQEKFETYISNNSNNLDVNVLLYLGVSQLELENYEVANNTFQKIIESDALDFSKGYWYQALVFLKIKDKEKATKTLQIIADNPDYFNHNKAIEVLEKLN